MKRENMMIFEDRDGRVIDSDEAELMSILEYEERGIHLADC